MKNFKFSIILILTIFALTGCDSSDNNNSQDKENIPVRLQELKKVSIKNNITAAGQFTTEDEAFLSFKTGGIIKKICVKEGDAIKKGQLLAILDLNEINAQVAQAEAAYDKAKRDYERVNNLYKDSVASKSQMQDVKTGFDVASNNLQIAKFNRNYSEIRAIADGFILKRLVNEGQLIGSGTPVLQTNGANSKDWFLKISVSDNEWASIRLNDKALVEIDSNPGETLNGYVIRKSEGVDPYSGTFSISIKVTDTGIKLASGLFGKAEIIPSETINVWTVPFESLLDGDGNSGYVFVTNDTKTALKTKVKISGFSKNLVYISGGLENCKYLIISGSAYLNDNSSIKPVR